MSGGGSWPTDTLDQATAISANSSIEIVRFETRSCVYRSDKRIRSVTAVGQTERGYTHPRELGDSR